MTGEWVFWLEDLTQNDAARVGRKCANLGELTQAGFNVPPGFALCLDAYDEFLRTSGAGDSLAREFAGFNADPDDTRQLGRFSEASQAARALVENQDMPDHLAAAIAAYYDALCTRMGIVAAPVATRSAGAASHPGQYESYLNLSGRYAVLDGVKKVWSSTFNTRSLVARARKRLLLESDPIGVAVLAMVDADAAGVMFTAEPTTADGSRIIIEGSCGLGETVVGGGVIPDNWTVDATSFAIIERNLAPAAPETRDETGAASASADASAAAAPPDAAPPDTSAPAPCLFDDEIVALARVGKAIEKHFGKPQDIEWAIDRDAPGDPVFILQTRPETFRIDFRF
jgi:phosphoenolpyruvate synthase/pyruvate phosphate dikinase